MQRWFFLEDPSLEKIRQKPINKRSIQNKEKMSIEAAETRGEPAMRQLKFSVSIPDLGPLEKVFITGNIPELGQWKQEKVVQLLEEDSELWSITLAVPFGCDIYFRYCICVLLDEPKRVLVRRWETNIHPRKLSGAETSLERHAFGEYDGKTRFTKGWLTTESLVQFKFFNNPFNLKSRHVGRLISIKVTPVKLSFSNENHCADESSLSADTTDALDKPVGVFVEVASLDNDSCQLQQQDQFGRVYNPNDFLLFNVVTCNPEDIAYLVDFYTYSTRAAPDDPPYHLGYTYVLPTMFKPSEGQLELPVTCSVKHRPLGTINIEYLFIKPMGKNLNDLKVSYVKYWDPSWKGLEVGHRGLGASFKTKEGNAIRENTIASLKQAAASGADLLEFDVQLSKDKIPVIYHDFHVCISMKRKKQVDYTEMLELPVKDLSLEQLQKLKVYHLVEGRNNETRFFDDDLEEHQPFPTLQEALKNIDYHVGFNVELKWTMELNDGTFELNNPFDMNTYVDKVLEVVLQHGGERRIVMSCFNPDICTMVRNKQNKYPVMFLTQGKTTRYPMYRDPRCLDIPAAVQNAVSSDILGVVVHTEDLLRDPTQMKLATDAGLVIFCWGEDNNDKNTIKRLKEMGLHAVIYDKLDQFTTKEIKESIFLMEARESQKEMIRQVAEDQAPAPCDNSTPTNPSTPSTASAASIPLQQPFLDLSVRSRIVENSTTTSLESLSSVEIKDNHPDKPLKRTRDLNSVDKEVLLKKPSTTFLGVLSSPVSQIDNERSASKSDASVKTWPEGSEGDIEIKGDNPDTVRS